jgi:DNA-binding IclR family transcriptional regulator
MDGKSRTLSTTKLSLEIIELLAELEGAGVTRIAETLDKPPSTIHGHLSTLHEAEFVVRDGEQYRIGLKFLKLGKMIENSEEHHRRADKYTAKVADELDARSIFAVEEHGWCVYISRNAGDLSVWKHEMTGKRTYLHATAAGKAILANLPEETVDEILDRRGLPQLTESTITDRAELDAELQRVREQEVAFNREESVEGVKAVSAPVLDSDGQVFGALSANGPAKQMIGEQFETEMPKRLRGIANEFELDLQLS